MVWVMWLWDSDLCISVGDGWLPFFSRPLYFDFITLCYMFIPKLICILFDSLLVLGLDFLLVVGDFCLSLENRIFFCRFVPLVMGFGFANGVGVY